MTKRIVICSDGTWNQPNQEFPTNVVKAARAILPLDSSGTIQAVFYDPGVGSEGGFWERIRGGVTGKGLDKNIQDAYRFLMQNYEPGDEVILSGFSRGAYTVRSTVGLLRNVGLLKQDHEDKLAEAFEIYRDRKIDSHPNSTLAKQFRADYSNEIEVKFLGVWDTVGALGIPVRGLRSFTMKRYGFHDLQLSSIVSNAYHALALDERRVPFKPSLCETTPDTAQRVEQVWFVGVHTDVGGGNANDALADVTFHWLMGKAASCGLALNQQFIDTRTDPYPFGPRHNSMTWWYGILGSHVRPLGRQESAATEMVHRSAVNRLQDSVFSYNPPNLRRYLRENEERIAE